MFTAQPYINDLDGRTRSVVLTPNVGADFLFQVPDGYMWDFLSLDAKLVTSAAVANRIPTIVIDDGANHLWHAQPAAPQAASTSIDYMIGEGIPRDATVASLIYLPAFNDVRLFAGWRVFAITALLDAGDKWFAAMSIREYQTNPISGPRYSGRRQKFAAPQRPGRAY